MCCTQLVGNTGRKNDTKNCHLCTTAQLCRAESSPLRHVSTIGKNLLNSNISSTCPHNMVNFGPLAAEIGSGDFSGFRVLASLLQRRCLPEANQTLHNVCPSPALLHYIHFRGFLPSDRILPRAKFTLHPSLAFCYIGSVTARHSSSGVSQTLRHGTRNCFTELSWRAPPIFGWAAITLDIIPHSSWQCTVRPAL